MTLPLSQYVKKISVIGILALAVYLVTSLGHSSDDNGRSLSSKRQPFDDMMPNFQISNIDGENELYENGLKLVWLIAYPCNPATINKFVQITTLLSGRATATTLDFWKKQDYGNQYRPNHESIPVFDDKPGPSFTSESAAPDKYVLTRTQGYGWCADCHPEEYLGFTGYMHYMTANLHANTMHAQEVQEFMYDIRTVEKLLIMTEKPADIMVAVFLQEFDDAKNKGDNAFMSKFPMSPDGIRAYCKDRNENSQFHEDEEIWYRTLGFWEEAKDVPCRADFVKMFNFYNRALDLADRFEFEFKVVDAKDFGGDCKVGVIDDVFDYLALKRVKDTKAANCHWGGCPGCFNPQDQLAIARLGKKMLLPELQSDFEPYWK